MNLNIINKAVLCASLSASNAISMETKQFNPEQADFSKTQTIRTWVSSKYQSEDQIEKIQRDVSSEVPENNFSNNFIKPIRNNNGDFRNFGRTHHALCSIQLPFLQFVNSVSKSKDPIVLEIAAAWGLVTWKIPYAFENNGMVYANELSSNMLNGEFEQVMNHTLNSELRKMVQKIPGDCFNIPVSNPELVGKVDAIYVQNLEHFFNPEQHQKFLGLLDVLLSSSGRAYLCNQTILPTEAKKGNPVYDLYCKHKEKEVYPGFMKRFLTVNFLNPEMVGGVICTDCIRPRESELCIVENLSAINKLIIKQETTSNFFTPRIYRNAIEHYNKSNDNLFYVVDAHFIDSMGYRHNEFKDVNILYAASIIEKNYYAQNKARSGCGGTIMLIEL